MPKLTLKQALETYKPDRMAIFLASGSVVHKPIGPGVPASATALLIKGHPDWREVHFVREGKTVAIVKRRTPKTWGWLPAVLLGLILLDDDR